MESSAPPVDMKFLVSTELSNSKIQCVTFYWNKKSSTDENSHVDFFIDKHPKIR